MSFGITNPLTQSTAETAAMQWLRAFLAQQAQAGGAAAAQGLGQAGQWAVSPMGGAPISPAPPSPAGAGVLSAMNTPTTSPVDTGFPTPDPALTPNQTVAPPAGPNPPLPAVAQTPEPAPAAGGDVPLAQQTPVPAAGTGGLFDADETLANLNDAMLDNPRLGFLQALGPNMDRNYLLRRGVGQYAELLPVLSDLMALAGGTGEVNVGDFIGQIARGLTSRGGGLDVLDLVNAALARATGGDEDSRLALEDIGPGNIVRALTMADRQRGVLPGFSRARQTRRMRELEQQELARLQRGAGTGDEFDDTAAWARFLAGEAARR